MKTRRTQIRLETPPLEEQVFRSHLPGKYIGYSLENYFSDRFPFLSREEWRRKIDSGHISVNGLTAGPDRVLKEHDFLETRMGLRPEPPANRSFDIIHEDGHVRVFDKGAPLPIHPSGRFFRNSMTEILKERYQEETPRPVQRLDALTTGLVVFAKTRSAARFLMHAFAENRVRKVYLALVEGSPCDTHFEIDAPIGKVVGSARGVGDHLDRAKPARTRVQRLSTLGTRSLLRVIPETGRTNQIRVHLAHRGLPLINDPVYGTSTETSHEYGLHAYRLSFPSVDGPLDLTAPWPEHFQPFVEAAGLGLKEGK